MNGYNFTLTRDSKSSLIFNFYFDVKHNHFGGYSIEISLDTEDGIIVLSNIGTDLDSFDFWKLL